MKTYRDKATEVKNLSRIGITKDSMCRVWAMIKENVAVDIKTEIEN